MWDIIASTLFIGLIFLLMWFYRDAVLRFLPLNNANQRVNPPLSKSSNVRNPNCKATTSSLNKAFNQFNSPEALRKRIQSYMNSQNVLVIFSKTWCPFCDQVKQIAGESNLPTRILELDKIQDGSAMHEVLKELSGLKSVPNIFVSGYHIGGCDDFVNLLEKIESLQGPLKGSKLLQTIILVKANDKGIDEHRNQKSSSSSDEGAKVLHPVISPESKSDLSLRNENYTCYNLKRCLEIQSQNNFYAVDVQTKLVVPTRSISPSSSMPEISPLRTVEELLSWMPGNDPFNIATCILKPCQVPSGSSSLMSPLKRQLLVCHDMAGGYNEDSWPQGFSRSSGSGSFFLSNSEEGFYRIYQWEMIDTFVYFSHDFVTIPPSQWINCAHRHGTRVLGTIITEGKDGLKRCDEYLFVEKSSAEYFASQLIAIAKYYGFDGWLLNFENPIRTGLHMQNLLHFVSFLTENIHSAIPGSQIIWYDSVLSTTGGIKMAECSESVQSGIF